DIASATSTSAPQATTAPPPLRRVPDDDAIDLLETAGMPVLKRVAPVIGALVLLLVVWRLVARRRS
ncbi:MAG: SRPBCC family protein, partial [Actinomycetes bacterium]